MSGTTCVSFRTRNSIGIELQLFRHLVHRDLERHRARRIAGRAHGVALRQIEHREPRRRHAVGAGIDAGASIERRTPVCRRQIARPALVADRRELAVARRAEADSLNRRRAMRRVVEHQRPRQRHLHRASSRARAERREQRVGAYEQLAAEAAADVRRDQAHVLLRQPERLRQIVDAPVDHLVRRPDGELVAVPGGDRSVRLHHRVRLIGRGVGRIELDGRGSEGAGEVADRRIRRAADDASVAPWRCPSPRRGRMRRQLART